MWARWPLVTMQWLMAIVYLDAVMSKMVQGGLDWMNGYTLQHYLLWDGLRKENATAVWLAQQHHLAILLSCLTVMFEATFVLAVIRPRLRWFYIPLGSTLHAGMYVTMETPFFQFVALYCVFVPWSRLRWPSRDPEPARLIEGA